MEPTATAVTMARAEGGDAAAVEKVQRPSAPEKASRGKLLGLLASVGGLAMLALIVLEGVAWWLGRRSRG
jgi:hypothetical protein